jgi:putative glycosyltransferase (TIGR04372 family)
MKVIFVKLKKIIIWKIIRPNVVIFLNILKSIKLISIVIVDVNAIGHNIGDFLNMLNLQEKSCIRNYVLYSNKYISNTYVPNLWIELSKLRPRTFIVRIPNCISNFIIDYCKFATYPAMSSFSGCSGAFPDSEFVEKCKITATKYILNLPKSDRDQHILKNILGNDGDKAKICTILNRDSSFRNVDTARDSDIKVLIPAIEMLINQGYTVIRISKLTNLEINYENPKYFEITNESYSDYLFLRLILESEFTLSSWFGPMEILRLLKIPVFFYNCPPSFREFPIRKGTYVLPFELYDQNNVKLKFPKLLDLILSNVDPRDASQFERLGLKILHRDAQLIKNSVSNFIENEFYLNHSSCIRCLFYKKNMSELISKRKIMRSGVNVYNVLLTGNDFLNANFCLNLE